MMTTYNNDATVMTLTTEKAGIVEIFLKGQEHLLLIGAMVRQ